MEEKIKEKFSFGDVLIKVFIAIAVIFLVFSVWGLYASLNELISMWIGYKYAPVYRALLNLAVIILAIYVINLLVKRGNENLKLSDKG